MKQALIVAASLTALAFGGGYGAGLVARPVNPDAPAQAIGSPDPAGPSYVEVGQFAVPVLSGGRTTSFILAQITVAVAGPGQAEALRRQLPRLRDALLQGMYGMAGNGFFEGPAVDPAAAARNLEKVAEERLGPGIVRSVLFERLLRQDNRRG